MEANKNPGALVVRQNDTVDAVMETADATTKVLAEEITRSLAMAMPDELTITRRTMTTADAIAIVTTVVEETITIVIVEETMDNTRRQKAIMANMFIMWRKSNTHLLTHH